jgi:hypothetical protein
LLKYLKISGYWEYDEDMIKNMNLEKEFKKALEQYKGSKNHATTQILKDYLQDNYFN